MEDYILKEIRKITMLLEALASLLLSVKGSMSMYRQGQVEILNSHIRKHFQSEGYLSLALWQ